MVVEGLCGLVKKAKEIGEFKGFSLNDSLSFSLLQYIGDSILVRDACCKNFWVIKGILRSFELVLKVNFLRSKIFGVNVFNEFLDDA